MVAKTLWMAPANRQRLRGTPKRRILNHHTLIEFDAVTLAELALGTISIGKFAPSILPTLRKAPITASKGWP